jgi:hypothetical protein
MTNIEAAVSYSAVNGWFIVFSFSQKLTTRISLTNASGNPARILMNFVLQNEEKRDTN